jgi:hypothetical protein
MKLKSNHLLTIIIVVLSFIIISGREGEQKFTNYSAVYNDNDYIVLKRNTQDRTNFFVPNPAHGKLIPDSIAEAEIKMYREKNPGATRYIDFNFHALLGYVASFQNVENPDANKNLGVRIYPALDLLTKQLTVIISPTRNDQSLWKNKNLINGRDLLDDVEAFNTGSACPLNCPDGDTTSIPK